MMLGALLAGLVAACGDAAPTVTKMELEDSKGAIVSLPDIPTSVPTIVPATNAPAAALTATPVRVAGLDGGGLVGATPVPPTVKPVVTPTPTPYPTPALKIPPLGAPKTVDFSGKGQVLEVEFHSTLLNKDVQYRIYLPQEYATSQKRYPVLYMLHGYSGKIDEWMWYGLLDRFDEMINTRQVKPFIIVLPFGDQEYWMDHPDNGPAWGEYVAHEVVDHIDGNYRTLPFKESRAIGGLSMGGNGALQVSMNYPNIFGVIGAHSPTMRTYDQKIPWWGDEDWFLKHDPVAMVKTNQYISQVKLWIDIGSDDKTWRPRALELKQNLLDRKIAFKWTDFPGDHNAEYWTAHVPDYLSWYNSVLVFP